MSIPSPGRGQKVRKRRKWRGKEFWKERRWCKFPWHTVVAQQMLVSFHSQERPGRAGRSEQKQVAWTGEGNTYEVQRQCVKLCKH